jgi:hypothetical protein
MRVICLVESIYLDNLTLKMMLSYNKGNIFTVIKRSILLHEATMDSFSRLSGSKKDDDKKLLLMYIIERYGQMQGIFFVKHLKGNSGNQVQKLADCQATRTKVAQAVVYAKKEDLDDNIIITDDTPPCQVLQETAADNVFELSNTDD